MCEFERVKALVKADVSAINYDLSCMITTAAARLIAEVTPAAQISLKPTSSASGRWALPSSHGVLVDDLTPVQCNYPYSGVV